MPVTVEFMGLPGSGKTTLSKKLVALLEQEGIKALDNDKAVLVCCRRSISGQKSAKNLLNACMLHLNSWLGTGSVYHIPNIQILAHQEFLLENQELVDLVLQNLNRGSIDDYVKLRIMNSVFQDFSSHQLFKKHLGDDEVVVVDEGFCQRATSIWGRIENGEYARSEMEHYFDLVPLPDVAMVVEPDVETCERRLSERSRVLLLRNMNHEERIAKLNEIGDLIKEVSLALERKGVPLLTINNSGDISASIGEDVVQSVVRSARGG
jgi:deoxyadenosine/deoxycytidine kinase